MSAEINKEIPGIKVTLKIKVPTEGRLKKDEFDEDEISIFVDDETSDIVFVGHDKEIFRIYNVNLKKAMYALGV